MRRALLSISAGIAVVAASLTMAAAAPAPNPASRPLPRLAQTIVMPDVKGGFDLMAVDVAQQRLFVDAEDNNTTEVLSLAGAGRRIGTIRGMRQPKWVVYRPELSKLYIANGDGRLSILDSSTFRSLGEIRFKEPANNLRFDVESGMLFVGIGDSGGAISVVDPRSDKLAATVPLSSYPKQFEVEGTRIFVNLPKARKVEVLDWTKRQALASWKPCRSDNVPMALDRTHRRLFIGCEGGNLVILDSQTGDRVGDVPIPKGADGIWYDAEKRRLYVSCAEGFVAIIDQDAPNGYRRAGLVATRRGAGTSRFSPEMRRLFVALPQTTHAAAEVRAYEVGDPPNDGAARSRLSGRKLRPGAHGNRYPPLSRKPGPVREVADHAVPVAHLRRHWGT